MWRLLFLPLAYLAAVLDTTLGSVWSVGTIAPDALEVLAFAWVVVERRRFGLLVAGAVGLLADLLASGRVGPGMSSFFLAALLLSALQRRWQPRHPLVQAGLIAPVAALSTLATRGVSELPSVATMELAGRTSHALGVGLYTAAVAVPVLMLLGWIRPTR